MLTAILTMGVATAYTIPTKNNFAVWMAVVDSSTDRIVFYNTEKTSGRYVLVDED